MKNALIIVGKALKYNIYFTAYLKREVTSAIGVVDITLFIGKNDETIASTIKDILSNYENVIIATAEGFELVGKILSTQTSDALVYKQNMLLPLKSIEIEEDSYMLKNVNVLRINVNKKIPKILLQIDHERRVFIFCDAHEAQRFEKLAHIFEVACLGDNIIDGVWHFSLLGERELSVDRFLKEARVLITDKIVLGDDLSCIVAKRLIEGEKTITYAESCTGGLIASELVKNSGVSSIFKGSIVSYSNEIKSGMVGVKKETLEKFGAVSKECVYEMLDGSMDKFDSDFAVAVSGVAGPDGGTKDKPVGTVIIGAKSKDFGVIIKRLSLNGDRIFIQKSTLLWALKLLFMSDENFFFKFIQKSLDK